MMHNSPIVAAAKAHREQLLREAKLERLAARAAASRHAHRRAGPLRLAVLEPSDERRLAALFDMLSPRSRYLRYLAPIRMLPPRGMRQLASIDHVDHEAVGVFDGDVLIGAAHYVRSPDDPNSAEFSVEVADSYQRVGIGTRLVHELARIATCRGLRRLTATTLTINPAIMPMSRRLELPISFQPRGHQVELSLLLAKP
jgi:GNAT superfamily N-acetyltransferase